MGNSQNAQQKNGQLGIGRRRTSNSSSCDNSSSNEEQQQKQKQQQADTADPTLVAVRALPDFQPLLQRKSLLSWSDNDDATAALDPNIIRLVHESAHAGIGHKIAKVIENQAKLASASSQAAVASRTAAEVAAMRLQPIEDNTTEMQRHVGDVHEMVVNMSELLHKCVMLCQSVQTTMVERFEHDDGGDDYGVAIPQLRLSRKERKESLVNVHEQRETDERIVDGNRNRNIVLQDQEQTAQPRSS